MMRAGTLLIVLVASISHRSVGSLRPVELKIGDQAPPFSLVGSDGRTYRLADFRDKQVVVLAWFAKAFTSG